jgi:exopolysaccharide production protein ExoQ
MTHHESHNLEFPAIATLLEKIALFLPAAVIAYPVLIWPLVYPSTVDEMNGLVAPATVVPEYLLNKIYFPILFVLAAFSLVVSRRQLPRQFCTFGCAMFAILAFFALSSLWSLAPNITIRRTALEAMVCATILMSTLSIPNPQRVIIPVAWLLVVAMFINLIPVLLQPAGKIGHPGIYNHKNALGQTSCLAFLVFLYGIAIPGSPRLRAACILAIGVSLFTLFQSRSKTAQGLAFLSPVVGLYLYFVCRTCRVPLLYVMTGSVVAFICGYVIFSEVTGIVSGDIFLWLFNDETFSGRTIIWQFVWEKIQEKPMLGYGFEGFWDIGPSSPKFKTQNFIARMPHAHNGYLEVMLETGVIGFTLFMFFLLVVIRLVGRMTKVDGQLFYFFVTLLPYILINETMEHDIFSPMPPNWNFLVLIGAISCALNGYTLRPRLRLN